MSPLPPGVDAPVKATKLIDSLTATWSFVAVTDCDRASAKGSPAGDLVEYGVSVEGDGAVYLCEGDVTELDPVPTGIKVTAANPFNGTCRATGVAGVSLRSVPDGVTGQLVIGASSFT